MKSISALKIRKEDFDVEYEIINPLLTDVCGNEKKGEILQEIQSIDKSLEKCEEKIAQLNEEIDRLTNHADGQDYTIAALSGVISGMIDVFLSERQKSIKIKYKIF